MVEATAAITPSVAVPPVQRTQPLAPIVHAADTNNTASVNTTTAFEQAAALQNEELLLNIGQAASTSSSASDDVFLDGAVLANLSPQALTVLNEVNTAPANLNGNLTPDQLQEIAILEDDAQLLNGGGEVVVNVNTDDAALNSASTVNLSPQAINILSDIEAVDRLNAGNSLTTAQLQQIAGILTPFVNQPFTPQVLSQIQAAFAAAGFSNTTQLSLQTFFLSMNFLPELLASPLPDAEEVAANEAIAADTAEFAE